MRGLLNLWMGSPSGIELRKAFFTRQQVRRRGLFLFEDDAVGTEFLDDVVDHAVDIA